MKIFGNPNVNFWEVSMVMNLNRACIVVITVLALKLVIVDQGLWFF